MFLLRTYPVLAVLLLSASCEQQPGAVWAHSAQVTDASRQVGDGVPQVVPVVPVDPGTSALVAIPAGEFEPLFPGKDAPKKVPVAAFELESQPVSNAQFAAFVYAVPKWRRSRVPRLFADRGYLALWEDDLNPGDDALDQPVTGISWFAARAYCKWRGRRLPTVAEWELAAALPLVGGGSPSKAALQWYGRPAGGSPAKIGAGSVSENGLRDLHGLVWEWVDDFSSSMVTGDARSDTDFSRSLFCGAGAIGSARPEDYASFMRYAMRSSLTGDRTTRSLGFRCAQAADSQNE